MTPVFDSDYANQYDLLYADKDYEAECDLLESIFERYTDGNPQSILDLGCGTGNHAVPLAQRGYDVVGVDFSENMLSLAKEKATRSLSSKPPVFYHGDAANFDINTKFDVVLMMFAVLGYQLENVDVLATLKNVRKHLKHGGLFVFDVWYGPAVLSIRPSERIKIITSEDGQLIRSAAGTLDTYRQLAEVRYHLWHIRGQRVVSETQESHLMRYFFAQELIQFLDYSGLELTSLTAFPSLDEQASEGSWNVLGIAR